MCVYIYIYNTYILLLTKKNTNKEKEISFILLITFQYFKIKIRTCWLSSNALEKKISAINISQSSSKFPNGTCKRRAYENKMLEKLQKKFSTQVFLLRKQNKKRKENSRSRIGRKLKKHPERSLGQTISEQYRIVTKWTRKRKPQPKVVLSLWLPTKSCALATFSPRTKQKQKRKRPKNTQSHHPKVAH